MLGRVNTVGHGYYYSSNIRNYVSFSATDLKCGYDTMNKDRTSPNSALCFIFMPPRKVKKPLRF